MKFDKTDPVHNALREGLGKLVRHYFAAILAAEGTTTTQAQPTKGHKISTVSRKPLSAAAKSRIAAAQRKRWAQWRKDNK